MTTPNLAGVINKDDVFKKGGADYIPWSRIAQYVHKHANGYEFALETSPTGGHVWQAPNGTGYLVGYWTGPERQISAHFVYAITDHRNQPIAYDSINARQLCDSHRRAFCAAAAWQFGLGGELWARQEIADAQADEPSLPPSKAIKAKPETKPVQVKVEPVTTVKLPADPPATKDEIALILNLLKDTEAEQRAKIIDSYCAEFGLPAGSKIASHVTTATHVTFLQQAIN